MRVLIIEDEKHAAQELQRILLDFDCRISIVAIIDSVEEGIAFLTKNPHPDLIFSDIQLADGMCFEIYESVQVNSPIIFCTAFDEYVMDAFKTNAVSYVLKPITEEKVTNALDKFKQLKQAFEPKKAAAYIAELSKILKAPYKTALLVNQRENIIPLQIKDIVFFYLDNTMVKIGTMNNHSYLITSSLDELERILDPSIFYRANRQFIINRNAIINVERYFARKLVTQLNVKAPERVVISKGKASDFLKWLEGV